MNKSMSPTKFGNRRRCPNFTTQEKLKLIEIISKFKQIIKSKLNTGKSIKAKRKAWENITRLYNSEVWTFNRSTIQLRVCYESISKEARAKRQEDVEITAELTNKMEIENAANNEYEYMLKICDENINPLDTIPKIEDQNSTTDLNVAATIPCQHLNSPFTSQQQEMILNTVEGILAGRSDRNITCSERFHQQELQFRRDEHDMDMQIKLQKLENERRICERLALETTTLRLESKVMMKSSRAWKLKF